MAVTWGLTDPCWGGGMLCSVHEECDCVRSFRCMCEIVCAVVDASVLVSIVVSIHACHAGDTGSIPGLIAFAHCSLL